MKQGYCISCMKWQNLLITRSYEIFVVRGVKVPILADVSYCECCGTPVCNSELDEKNLLNAQLEYKRLNNQK